MAHIPPRRIKTPEEQRIADEEKQISELYVRWVNNQLVPEDDFLLMLHQERLEAIKTQADWMVKFNQDKLDWKIAQMGLNSTRNKEDN